MMSGRKISNYVFIVATVLTAVVTLCLGIYEYRREHMFRVDILHSQLELNNYRFLEGSADPEIRVTVIDTLGNVLYDTEEEDVSRMDNHLQREEIQEALHDGSGYAIKRASETTGEKYFYSASRFEDRIIRSSVPYSAELTSSLEHNYTFFYYTAGILALIAVVMYFRYRFGRSEQEKQRIKRQLTENAAHELKTPAATIEGYLDTLIANPSMTEEQRREFLERCHAQSLRMCALLSDMSTLTRLDEAHIVRPQTPIDAALILLQIHKETEEEFKSRGILVNMNIPDTLPMKGDSSFIYSLFRNIFNNTIAYASGATTFEVQVSSTWNRYAFKFIDNGVGVPAEHLAHIFERFYRVDKGRSRQLGGTGLGLAIVKNIALQYGGSASASNTPGGGLTVTVELDAEPR